jgi:hypothetical protein
MDNAMTPDEHATYHKAQDAAYNTEHFGAYFMVAVAIILGVLGILTAFQVVELRDYDAALVNEAPEEGAQGTAEVEASGLDAESTSADSFWDGILLLTTGLAAATLALCLHLNDHHRMRDPRTVNDTDTGLWTAEHALAYLAALAAIVIGVVAVLTGFDAFGTDTDQRDGIIWAFAAFGAALIATTLHVVRHHQTIAEEDHLVRLVEGRVGATAQRSPTGQTGERGYTEERGSSPRR